MAGNSGIDVGFGTAGQVLTSNGPGVLPTFQAAPGGGALVFIQTQTASSVASLAFTTGITATYDDYLLVLRNGSIEAASNLSQVLTIQISSNGGSSYISSGYLVDAGIGITSGATIVCTTDASNPTNYIGGEIYMLNLTAASNKPSWVGYVSYYSPAVSVSQLSPVSYYAGGSINVNAFQIVMTDGSNFSGIFSLYGILS